jgi:hypothetical protein
MRWQSAQVKKELDRLCQLASKFANGLGNLGDGAQSALDAAHSEEEDAQLLSLQQQRRADLERWRARLERALQINREWRANLGRKNAVRAIAIRLDALLLQHTKHGLARTSRPKTNSKGRASASMQFVTDVVTIATGNPPSDRTLRDAIQNAQRRRPRVVGQSNRK